MIDFEYEHRPIYFKTSDTYGEKLGDIGMWLPVSTIGRWKPTTLVTKIIYWPILFTIVLIWLYTIGFVLIVIGTVLTAIEYFWKWVYCKVYL